MNFIEDNFPIDAQQVQIESKKDRCISMVLEFVKSEWPTTESVWTGENGVESREFAAYRRHRDQLFVEGGCLMRGCRVVVPPALRPRLLAELHASHLGVVKCKGLARAYVWWPGLDDDIERMCAACSTCAETADSPPKTAIVPWSWPTAPFERIHIDFFFFKNSTYMIVIDSHSKWIEVVLMSVTNAANTINKLKEIFARFGIPKKLVSDNGPLSRAKSFNHFLKTIVLNILL